MSTPASKAGVATRAFVAGVPAAIAKRHAGLGLAEDVLPLADRAAKGAAKGKGGAPATPARETWYAEGGQVFDNLYLLTTKTNSANRVTKCRWRN